MIDVDALLATPLVHTWGTAPATRPAQPGESANLGRAHALALSLAPSVSGHGGDEALLRAATELSTVLGEDAGAILFVLAETFNPRCAPPWPTAKLEREATRAAERQTDPAARYARRAAARAAPDVDAPAFHAPEPPPEAAGGAVFLMTPRGRDVWYYDPRVEGYRECGRESLHVSLEASGAAAYVETHVGPKRRKPQDILDDGPTIIVRTAVTDFSRSAEAHHDHERERVLLGVACPAIAPAPDAAVFAWLDALAGGAVNVLHEWIASTRQDTIHRLATALALIGPHGAGKTLIAIVCARLWGSTPVELAHVAAQFNATMARCPVVLDDECACLSKRIISTEDFRVLVQARVRDYEPKGKERRTLIGAQRFVLTANDMSALTFSNAVGAGAADAIAERLTVIDCTATGARARALLDELRLEDGEIDFPRLDAHFEWIRQTTALPDGRARFLGANADRAPARAAVLANTLAEHSVLYDRLRALLEGTRKADRGAFLAAGAVWVRVGPLTEALAFNGGGDRWDTRRLRAAVAPFRGPRDCVRVGDEIERAWELDATRLVEATGANVERVLAALGAAG